jgi:hypothetical protein
VTGSRRLTVWTYRRAADEHAPERIQAVITEGGEGSVIRTLNELPGGAFLNDRFPAHCEIAQEVTGCPVVLVRVRPSGAGYVFWGFPGDDTGE